MRRSTTPAGGLGSATGPRRTIAGIRSFPSRKPPARAASSSASARANSVNPRPRAPKNSRAPATSRRGSPPGAGIAPFIISGKSVRKAYSQPSAVSRASPPSRRAPSRYRSAMPTWPRSARSMTRIILLERLVPAPTLTRMAFPATRMRRLRQTGALRDMVRETELGPKHLVYPMFVELGTDSRTPIESMPGIERLSISHAVEEAGEAHALGIPSVLLFGIPAEKDIQGSGAYDAEGVVQLAVRAIKEAHPELVVITDVCMCEYTSHGHCGIVRDDGTVDTDVTVELLAKTAISHAAAGADAVAPSDMMDGRVGALRSQLDAEGHSETPIIAYSAKFASAFYGPFREAAESTPAFGDRRSYQMDPSNADEAVREALLDVEEGADVVMVKPALPYLDVIRRVKEATRVPVAAYNVSGEYAMLKAAIANGWLDERAAVLESLTGIRRAGADIVITYHAKDAARWLQ